MSQIDLDRLASALRLTTAQRAQLESLARTAQSPGVVAGQGQPARQVNARVHVTPGASLGDGPAAERARAAQDPVVGAAHARLSPEQRSALRDIEPQVLKWIRASRANALLFTTDPLGALRKAAPQFDRKTLNALTTLRAESQRQAATMPALDGVDLRSVTLDAKPSAPSEDAAAKKQKQAGKSAGKQRSARDKEERS